jgi:hypothetical protein
MWETYRENDIGTVCHAVKVRPLRKDPRWEAHLNRLQPSIPEKYPMRKTESGGRDPSPNEIRASHRNRDETNGGKISDIRQFVNPEKPSNGY